MTALDVLKKGLTIVSTAPGKKLVTTCDPKNGTYTIYRVHDDGQWEELEKFFDTSGNHTDALLNWMLEVGPTLGRS